MPDSINELPKFSGKPTDPGFTEHYSQMIDSVNGLLGYRGSIPLRNHLVMNGNRVMAIGAPQDASDAVSSGTAESKYSAAAIRPQLEGSGASSLRSMRRINDTNQREQVSSYMNDLLSSVPNANTIYPILTNVSGGVQVMIPATKFTFADQRSIYLLARTDILSLPAQFAIDAISSDGTTVTVTTDSPSGLSAGQAATIVGVTPSSFNGTYTLISATPPYTLQYQLSLGALSGSGGYVQAGGSYYYLANKRSTAVHLQGPYSSETAQNRLQACFDGSQLVAVVVVTNSGGQVAQSGGGGSAIVGSPTAGSFF